MGFFDDLADAVVNVVILPITVPIKVVEKIGDIMTGEDK